MGRQLGWSGGSGGWGSQPCLSLPIGQGFLIQMPLDLEFSHHFPHSNPTAAPWHGMPCHPSCVLLNGVGNHSVGFNAVKVLLNPFLTSGMPAPPASQPNAFSLSPKPPPPRGRNCLPSQHFRLHLSVSLARMWIPWGQKLGLLSLTTCDTEALNKYLLNQWVWGARGYKRGPHTEPWGSGTLITCTGWQWTGTQDKKSRDASFSWLKAPGGRGWLPPCLTPSVTQKEAAHLELSALKWTAQVDLCPQGSRPCWLSQHSWADVLPSGVRLRAPCDYQVERETGQAGSFLKVFAWV